ncbi:MAG TPA: twin-arginine translocase TatA/TatE family subunit [Aliidongia sp.]|nr:twin-arginine translocase TatA/TatE family subunit [Aliidongia sp.]
MGGLSLVHWIIILFVIVLLFGAGRISPMMGELAKGMKAFKQGLKDDEKPAEPTTIGQGQPAQPIPGHQNQEHKVG